MNVKPWNDCTTCPSCGQACGTRCPIDGAEAPAAGVLRCLACGHEWAATQAELEQAARADAAWLERLEPEHRQMNAEMEEFARRTGGSL